jgi:hypothetical protein
MTDYTIGGSGGTNHTISNGGAGQAFWVRSGEIIDSIKIGGTLYGGSGGSDREGFTIPSSGSITLYQGNSSNFDGHTLVGYLELGVGGRRYTYGNNTGNVQFQSADGVDVRISNISSGTYVDSIRFTSD